LRRPGNGPTSTLRIPGYIDIQISALHYLEATFLIYLPYRHRISENSFLIWNIKEISKSTLKIIANEQLDYEENYDHAIYPIGLDLFRKLLL
jgi:hypothetical protein